MVQDRVSKFSTETSGRFQSLGCEQKATVHDFEGTRASGFEMLAPPVQERATPSAVGQLEYKLVWQQGTLIKVDPKNTSRTCPCCGFVSADNRKTQANFECVDCGFVENADVVGALNVLARGHRVIACGGVA